MKYFLIWLSELSLQLHLPGTDPDMEAVTCLECRWCLGLVDTEGLHTHLVEEHQMHHHKQLGLAVFLLSSQEVAFILASLEPRINLFKTKGVLVPTKS